MLEDFSFGFVLSGTDLFPSSRCHQISYFVSVVAVGGTTPNLDSIKEIEAEGRVDREHLPLLEDLQIQMREMQMAISKLSEENAHLNDQIIELTREREAEETETALWDVAEEVKTTMTFPAGGGGRFVRHTGASAADEDDEEGEEQGEDEEETVSRGLIAYTLTVRMGKAERKMDQLQAKVNYMCSENKLKCSQPKNNESNNNNNRRPRPPTKTRQETGGCRKASKPCKSNANCCPGLVCAKGECRRKGSNCLPNGKVCTSNSKVSVPDAGKWRD